MQSTMAAPAAHDLYAMIASMARTIEAMAADIRELRGLSPPRALDPQQPAGTNRAGPAPRDVVRLANFILKHGFVRKSDANMRLALSRAKLEAAILQLPLDQFAVIKVYGDGRPGTILVAHDNSAASDYMAQLRRDKVFFEVLRGHAPYSDEALAIRAGAQRDLVAPLPAEERRAFDALEEAAIAEAEAATRRTAIVDVSTMLNGSHFPR